ncbi:hypothetical protein [Streptomyces phaeochromogenes]|uniref:hypothetical protein n=1 Tax=Streptomyces phaeochromogenes TaxID=1923 RepID=UPI00371F8BE4
MKVRLAGELVTCLVFAMRLSYSGKAAHRIIASCGREAFLEGHVHALSVLGGMPTCKVCYDSLRLAVLTAEHNATIRGVVESPAVSDSTGAYSVPGTTGRLDVERGDGDRPHYAAADVPVRAGRRHPTRRPRPLPHATVGQGPCRDSLARLRTPGPVS